MFDYKEQAVREERLKDFRREADNQRLVNSVENKNDLLKSMRNALGNRLVSAGQNLLDEKQR